jgi:peptidoglycan/LPS O-acetylase OafA/YrhL
MMQKKEGAQPELYGIQILRGVAALMVVFHHASEESLATSVGLHSPDWLTTAGASGVDLFFVISGFIMLYVSFPTEKAPLVPGTFLLRRATRIYPLYWICCAAVIALWAIGLFASKVVEPSTVIESAVLLPPGNGLLNVAWTLSYEMYFYLIFAATLIFRSRTASVFVSSFLVVAFMFVASFLPSGAIMDFLRNPIVAEFCFGLLLGLAFYAGLRFKGVGWSLPAFFLILAAPLFVAHDNTNGLPPMGRVIAWGLPSVVILAAFISVSEPRGLWTRLAVLFGNASYAIYLTHPFVMVAYAKLLKTTQLAAHSQLAIIPVVVVLCIALGVSTHLWLERPIMKAIRSALTTARPKSLVTAAR